MIITEKLFVHKFDGKEGKDGKVNIFLTVTIPHAWKKDDEGRRVSTWARIAAFGVHSGIAGDFLNGLDINKSEGQAYIRLGSQVSPSLDTWTNKDGDENTGLSFEVTDLFKADICQDLRRG